MSRSRPIPSPPKSPSGPLIAIKARPWLVTATALAFGMVTALTLLTPWRLAQDVLVAWNLAAGVYLSAAAVIMWRSDTDGIERRAEAQDVGKWTILLLTGMAVAVCIVAIATELIAARDLHGWDKAVNLGLVGATIVTTWLFVHTTFALHYAHAYYVSLKTTPEPCLTFPDKDCTPDYVDFLYFAFIMGTAAQTADVAIASPAMRRLNLAHAVFAFFFNTTILAIVINIAASLVQ
ncbi:DUF1345 domain-containing protein [Asticcacaulis sp. YBE204]|uniref:DUF1345 domain-containing protein n=1 Tax=Asticcacaulis sp. YBE204 TaxID=1282363 RepID=UPI0003C40492|nr:DUF1345 domain-containing protein [Asticcacaulis sp. YBE204]ESQ78932.1 hypothetical protein AEYBE204_10945 [Asticcacaulis sp. YBE204]